MSSRDTRIDYLRVASIVFILLHHADDYGTEFLRTTPAMAQADDFLTWAALGVMFALSGFLTLRSSSSDHAQGWEHIRRRFARLYVPFVVALILFKMLGAFQLEWKTVFINAALLGPWIGPDVGTLWFVEILLYYHVVYAVWLSARRLRTRTWSIPIVMGVITLALALSGRFAGLALDPRIALYLPAFAGGACFGAALRFREDRRRWIQSVAAGVAVSIAVGAAVAFAPAWTELPTLGLVVATLITLIVGVLLSLPWDAATAATGASRLAHKIALGSYMAYLLHRLVFRFVANAAAHLGEVWVSVAVAASIPVALFAGVLLQNAYDELAGKGPRSAGAGS